MSQRDDIILSVFEAIAESEHVPFISGERAHAYATALRPAVAAHDAAILERAADKMCKACEADCEPLCLGRYDCDLRRAIIEGGKE